MTEEAVSRAPELRRATRYYFHRPDIEYGSAATWGPLGLMANRGLSVLQYENRERDLARYNWSGGWEALIDALVHPGRAIRRRGGWGHFLKSELIPANGRVWEWAWAANYSGHILAGGISYRQLWEWLDSRGVRYPKVVAGGIYYATMGLNEVIEHPGGPPGKSSAVADMYFFEPVGMLLFSIDGVAEFFAETLQAADWSPQASFTPDAVILNHSQTMAYKAPLPFQDRVRVLFLIGQGSSTGISVSLDPEYSLSGTTGFIARERIVDQDTGAERITPRYGGGLFLDRNGSLLASLTVSGGGRVGANVFPGVLPGPFSNVGLWLGRDEEGRASVGLSSTRTLGLGLGMLAR